MYIVNECQKSKLHDISIALSLMVSQITHALSIYLEWLQKWPTKTRIRAFFPRERDDMGFAVLLLHAYYNVSDYISMADSVACMRSSSHIACHVYMYILPLEKHTYGMCPGWHTPGYIFYEL